MALGNGPPQVGVPQSDINIHTEWTALKGTEHRADLSSSVRPGAMLSIRQRCKASVQAVPTLVWAEQNELCIQRALHQLSVYSNLI